MAERQSKFRIKQIACKINTDFHELNHIFVFFMYTGKRILLTGCQMWSYQRGKDFCVVRLFWKKNILKHISCCFFFCFFCRMSKFISSWGHQILIFLLSALGNIFQSPMANKNKNPVLDLQISWYITSNEVLLKEYYNVNVFKLTFSNCTKYWALK